MYHRENDQEDFLVLAGEALAIVEGEERPLRQWDFVALPGRDEPRARRRRRRAVHRARRRRPRPLDRPRLGRLHGRRGGAAPRRRASSRRRPTRKRRTPGSPRAGSRATARARCPTSRARSRGLSLEHGSDLDLSTGSDPGTRPLRRAALHQHHVAPLAALLRDPLAGADDPEAAALVQRDRGVVAGEDPGLDRPDALGVGPADELARGAPARRPGRAPPAPRRPSSPSRRGSTPAARPAPAPPSRGSRRRPAPPAGARRGARRPTPPTTAPSPRRCRRRAPPRRSGRTPASPPPAARRSSQLERTAHRQPFEEPAVVRDDDEAAVVGLERRLELLDRLQVEVVRRLVEDEAVDARARRGARGPPAFARPARGAGRGGRCPPARARTSRAACAPLPRAAPRPRRSRRGGRPRTGRAPGSARRRPPTARAAACLPRAAGRRAARRSASTSPSRSRRPPRGGRPSAARARPGRAGTRRARRRRRRAPRRVRRPPPTVGRSSCSRQGVHGFSTSSSRSRWFFAWLTLPRSAFVARRSEPPVRRASLRSPPSRCASSRRTRRSSV